jgi:hypothetical protein
MTFRAMWSVLCALLLCALALTGAAAADTDQARGIDPNQGESLVEVTLPSKAAAERLQQRAESYGVAFNDHYLRQNPSGTVTVTVFGTDAELAGLDAAGYEVGETIEGPRSWQARIAERQTEVRAENRAESAALDETVAPSTHQDEIVVLRVDYFENYAGRFLSVEAKDRLGSAAPTGGIYIGPTLSLSWNIGGGPIASTPRVMNVNIDPDTTPDTYIEHRELVRIGEAGSTDPAAPTRIRIGSSTGVSIEADVDVWLGGGLPPMGSNYLRDFTTRYLDPTEVYARFADLAAEFPNIAELIPLPYSSNGYQRRAQAIMSGATPPGSTPPSGEQSQAVVLTSRAWGHEGGNDITAEFVNPGVPGSPLRTSSSTSGPTRPGRSRARPRRWLRRSTPTPQHTRSSWP